MATRRGGGKSCRWAAGSFLTAALMHAPAIAQSVQPNVLAGHRACPGYTMANYRARTHPLPGVHGIRLQVGCRTAFEQYERYLRERGPGADAAYKSFLDAAQIVTRYHAENRFGSVSAGAGSERPTSSAADAMAQVQEIQRNSLGRGLQRHNATPLRLGAHEAREVLLYFFGTAPEAPDDNDRRFAQSLLLETAQISSKVGYVEGLFRSATRPSATPSSVVRAIWRALLRDLASPASVQQALESDHYLIVVQQIGANWRSVWNERMQTGDSGMPLRL